MFVRYWDFLEVNWDELLTKANDNNDTSTWEKDLWKEWLIIYQDTVNTLHAYMAANDLLPPTANKTANVTYWEERFEQDNFTIDVILSVIQSNGVYQDFLGFFDAAFGPNGFVTMNQTNVGLVIPRGMADIVAWISQ